MNIKYLFFFIIFTIPVYTQISLGIGGGSDLYNSNLSNKGDYLNSYWQNKFNFNINGEYFISDQISLNGIIEYSYYKFDHYSFDDPHIPEIRFISATGKNSNAIRVFTNIKFYSNPLGIFQSFLITGLGYMYENLGTITATFDSFNAAESTSEIMYEGRHNFVHSLGMGVRINVIKNLAFDVSGSYYSDYTNLFKAKMELGLIYLLN